jgi:hypothetical protein
MFLAFTLTFAVSQLKTMARLGRSSGVISLKALGIEVTQLTLLLQRTATIWTTASVSTMCCNRSHGS